MEAYIDPEYMYMEGIRTACSRTKSVRRERRGEEVQGRWRRTRDNRRPIFDIPRGQLADTADIVGNGFSVKAEDRVVIGEIFGTSKR
jgi:hypothetical protein